MIRATVCAAVAVACLAFAAPAQANMANPGLNKIAPAQSQVQNVHYRHYYHRHNYRRHRPHRYRHCWNHRVRVYIGHHRYAWRTVRRCSWRYRYY